MHLILNYFTFSQLLRFAKTSDIFYSSFFLSSEFSFHFLCPGSLLNWSWNRSSLPATALHLFTSGFNLAPMVTPYQPVSQLRPDLDWNGAPGWGGRVHGGRGVEHHSIWVLTCTVRTSTMQGEQKYVNWEKCKIHTTHIDIGTCLTLLAASPTLLSNLTPPIQMPM